MNKPHISVKYLRTGLFVPDDGNSFDDLAGLVLLMSVRVTRADISISFLNSQRVII